MIGRKITVLGIGNLLLKDEGVGIHAIQALEKESLPKNVELVDGAVVGFDLLPIIESCDKLIIIDAIKT
ncbi:MAG: hydrogenase maturation protease, partial [Candidatus Pacebacteria bacterium]|nr:hydrogenase maturation protease [Candidatus Paceibacterota bacterium]